ncbi:hypothetical protein NLX83_12760 [Allokutzneria sp. A3M-2-11 16]|uniref:hypothetical protein n=1 Tax=Allokutzneria sp. A3M-2-11 16 TaxID=2962043 RepID=UPI0020B77E7C|nr:hypothetical protein [Allokutzneria sp. A3M-2-11 16]MCP3800129.1 hypothetical protein [Allokutzneria sp. A3M-2-11 16]
MSREDGLPPGSALCSGHFRGWISSIRGWQEFYVSLICPEQLVIAAVGSAYVEEMRREVLETDSHNPDLLPTLLRVSADGMEVVLEGAASS